MLSDIWGSVSDFLGDGLSSLLESILHATIFKLCYYIERALCWLIGILMELFEVFAGLEPVTYNGQQQYLVNVFFSNKAINNIYWGMAIIGMVLIFVFAMWAVIRKMFDLEGKQQQSLGQIIWSAIRSLVLIVGLTLVVSVVLNATSILMRQIDYIFNNAYHLDQPQEREFSEEEYAAMGRVLATIGNYSMIPNSNNRYNLNLCFNDIRGDMYFLQQQRIFEFSYNDRDGSGDKSWQSVLAQIAKSADLTKDVSIDVYHEGIARSITAAMEYLQTSGNPIPVEKATNNYTVTERVHLDRMVFLLGTFRAAKNSAFNKHPAFDDALRGPYFYEDGRSIHNYDQVNDDFDIGFPTDYLLVWFASIALIFNLVVIILNCVARIFNMMLLYIIAPPFIASAPLDNGGKFRQWTIAFTIQSLSVFGTVIAMQLMLIYLPIVASPDLVLFKDRPLLNAIAQFMLVYGGSEAAKKAGSLVTGILADQAGMEAIRSGDMSGAAGRMINKASGAVTGALGVAAGVAGFALSPVTNTIKRPFKAAGDWWRKLGSGEGQARTDKAIKDEIAKNKAIEKYKQDHPEDAKYLGGGGGGGSGPSGGSEKPPESSPQPKPGSGTQPKPDGGGQQPGPTKQPPPIPDRGGAGRDRPKASEAEDAPRHGGPRPGSRMADIRERGGLDEGAGGGRRPAREMNNTSNRPSLDREPQNNNALPQNRGQNANPPAADPQENRAIDPQPPEVPGGQNGDPPKQEGKGAELPKQEDRGAELPPQAERRDVRSLEADDAPRRAPAANGRLGDIRRRSGLNAGSGAVAPWRERNAPGGRPSLGKATGQAQPPVRAGGARNGEPPQDRGNAPGGDRPQQVPQSRAGEGTQAPKGTGSAAPQQGDYRVERQSQVEIPAQPKAEPLPQSRRDPQSGNPPRDQAPRQDGYQTSSRQAEYQYQAPQQSAPAGTQSYVPQSQGSVDIPASRQPSGGSGTQPRDSAPSAPQSRSTVNAAPQQPGNTAQQQSHAQASAVPRSQRNPQPRQGNQSAPRQSGYQTSSQQAAYQYQAPQPSAPPQSAPTSAPAYEPQSQASVNIPASQQPSGGSAPRQSYAQSAPRQSYAQPQTQAGAGTVNTAPQRPSAPPQAAPRQSGYQTSSQQAAYQYQAPQPSAQQESAPTSAPAYEPRSQGTVNIPASQRPSGGNAPQQSYTQPQNTQPQYTQPRYTQPSYTQPAGTGSAPQQNAPQPQPRYTADAPRQRTYTQTQRVQPPQSGTVNVPPPQQPPPTADAPQPRPRGNSQRTPSSGGRPGGLPGSERNNRQ